MTKWVIIQQERTKHCLAVTKSGCYQSFFFLLYLVRFTRRCVISQLVCWHCCWILLFVRTDVTILMYIRNDHQSPLFSLSPSKESLSWIMTCIEFLNASGTKSLIDLCLPFERGKKIITFSSYIVACILIQLVIWLVHRADCCPSTHNSPPNFVIQNDLFSFSSKCQCLCLSPFHFDNSFWLKCFHCL